MSRKRAAKPVRQARVWSLYNSQGRLDVRVLIQLLSAWLLWLVQLLGSVRYVRAYLTSKRRLPYVIDEYGDVTYRPPKREWLRNLFSTEASIQRRLLDWVKNELPTHRIVDMTSSWSDGVALCALVEKLKPGSCPRHNLLKPLQRISNCKLALKLVQKYFSVPASVITPEEMAYCRDAKKMKQLLSLVRYFHRYPISEQLALATRTDHQCWAKGEGLRHGIVGRKSQFVVQTPVEDVTSLMVEIRGSNGEEGVEEITSAVPMRKSCKFFDNDSDGRKQHAKINDQNILVDYQCVGEGRFSINYLPRSSGHYNVVIKWHQDDIPGSPFTVRIDDVTSILREGNLMNPENLSVEGEWNYEQYGSTVIRRRSVVMDTGRRLSALAQEHEEKRKSFEEERKSPELVKQRTVTRRRVIKRIMTLGGREVTIDHDSDFDDNQNDQRRNSVPKFGLFETVAMAIKENQARATSPVVIDRVADDLNAQVFADVFSDVRTVNRTPRLGDSARENPKLFQQVRAESEHRESFEKPEIPVVREDQNNENNENNEQHIRSRNTSGGDSGIDLTNNGKKLSPSLEPVTASNDSQSEIFYPLIDSTPNTQSEETDSVDFETPKSSDCGVNENQVKDEVHSNFKVIQSPSLNKTCLYLTGANVAGTMSTESLKLESETRLNQQILALPSTETIQEHDLVGRKKLQTSKSLNYQEDVEGGSRQRSSSFSRRKSPKRSASPKRPTSPFTPKRSFDKMMEDFRLEQSRQQEKVGQRGSLTRQNDIHSLHIEEITSKDFGMQVSSDVIKRELNRQNGSRLRRRKRRVVPVGEENVLLSQPRDSETRDSFSNTYSDFSTYTRALSNLGPSSNDDVITMSTDDVTLPSMTSSVREPTPNVGKTEFKFDVNIDKTSGRESSTCLKSPSQKFTKPKNSPSKVRKCRKRNFKDRLEMKVTKWLRSLANSDETPDVTITKFKHDKVDSSSSSSSGRTSVNKPRDSSESVNNPSGFRVPCECVSYLANKNEYVRFFGELFDSELCQDCVAEFKAAGDQDCVAEFKAAENQDCVAEYRAAENQDCVADYRAAENQDCVAEYRAAEESVMTDEMKRSDNQNDIKLTNKPNEILKTGSELDPSFFHKIEDTPSTIFLDKQLLLGSRNEPKDERRNLSRDLTDFKMAGSQYASIGGQDFPENGSKIPRKSSNDFSRKLNFGDGFDHTKLTDENVQSRFGVLKKYENTPENIHCQEARGYEYKPSPPADNENVHNERESEMRWTPEQWQELTETSYLELPRQREVNSSDTKWKFTVGSTMGTNILIPSRIDQNLGENSSLNSRFTSNLLNDDTDFRTYISHSKNTTKSGSSTLDSRKTGFSCQTCPSDTTSSFSQGQGQGQGHGFSDSTSPATPRTERRQNLLSEMSQTLKQRPHDVIQQRLDYQPDDVIQQRLDYQPDDVIKQRLDYQPDDVIQQTSDLNSIFSCLDFLKSSSDNTGLEDERSRSRSFPEPPSRNVGHNFQSVLQSESSKTTNKVPSSRKPPGERNLSRTSSQNSIGRQFLDELDDLIRRHTELRELGYGESPNPGMCEAIGSGLSYGDMGVKNNFQVHTNHAGNGTLSISVHGPAPHSVTETNVLYTGDGLYEVFYHVNRPGYFIISVKWSDVNVPNSPFICKVE